MRRLSGRVQVWVVRRSSRSATPPKTGPCPNAARGTKAGAPSRRIPLHPAKLPLTAYGVPVACFGSVAPLLRITRKSKGHASPNVARPGYGGKSDNAHYQTWPTCHAACKSRHAARHSGFPPPPKHNRCYVYLATTCPGGPACYSTHQKRYAKNKPTKGGTQAKPGKSILGQSWRTVCGNFNRPGSSPGFFIFRAYGQNNASGWK